MEEFFDMEFVGLPHKVCLSPSILVVQPFKCIYIILTCLAQVLAPEKFEEAVVQLRLRFTDAPNPGFLFKPVYHKRIPADGVEHYMRAIWEQVRHHQSSSR